ncbi:acrosomal protein KIAA1210 homolog isoform X1 [Chelonoidis abingdonii]|uniref:acrosomal protein KIAA1210 homolog isoform X1 n=3 Tax=Chelonoidis abingdonii TaxID=106734 RepID=UPI0013F1F01A|nr:acrosomal protein KIAA1210 homolog isoform X2 [Chelonoidis abingdonii]
MPDRFRTRSYFQGFIGDYIMATGPTDVIQPPEAREITEECAGKKKSKFQTFKNFFAKKKRKESPAPRGESNLKPSQSSSDVSIPVFDTIALHSPTEPGSKGSMGNKALSHDSVFIFESAPENTTGDMSSQENIPGKVKTLQLQLQQNIRLGSSPLVITGRKLEDTGAISEDDGLPKSPPEISTLHEVLTCSPSKSSNPVQRHSSLSLGGTDSEDEQVPSDASSRPVSPLSSMVLVISATQASSLLPVDFNTPASPVGCLDTSAARHRIAINPRKQRVFTSKNQQTPLEQLEKEQSLPVTAEKKSTTKFLDADQYENWAGSLVLEENNGKGGGAKETQAITKTDNSTSSPRNSVSPADVVCTLIEVDACSIETDHQSKVTVSFPNVQSALAKSEEENKAEEVLVPYCSDDSIGEFKLLLQNTSEVIELSESLQTEPEAIVFQDTLASDSYGISLEKEDINSLADATKVSLKQPVDQSDKEPGDGGVALVGKVEEQPCTNENNFIWPDSDPAVCASQVLLATLEMSSEADWMAVSVPENTPAAKDDKEMCKVTELQPSKDHVDSKTSLQKDSVVSMSDIDCMLPQSKMNKELHFKPEMHCPVSKASQSNQETEAFNNLEKHSIRCLASSSLAGFKSCIPLSGDSQQNLLGGVTSQEKTRKESKSPEENVKTPLKSAATKPVRFTIAPAWQRSLSGGSNSKEDSCARSSPSSPIRPELFEGTAHLDTTRQESTKNNTEGFEGDNESNKASLNSSLEGAEHETQNAENPFGIRLRRTSSLLKYHSESPKQIPLAVHTTSSGSVKENQKSVATGRPLHGLPGNQKVLAKKSAVVEEKNAPKTKPEEVSKKQHSNKLSEKVPSPHLETVTSEPAWVSMAKLKQKGFQGHPLAKGHKREDKSLTKMDQEEQVTCASENVLGKNVTPILCAQEKKSQMKITMSATAVTLGPMAQEASVVPTTEKETRQSCNLPMTPCSSAEPPWLSLAKKKAKAWSEMPQIVQ